MIRSAFPIIGIGIALWPLTSRKAPDEKAAIRGLLHLLCGRSGSWMLRLQADRAARQCRGGCWQGYDLPVLTSSHDTPFKLFRKFS